MVLVLLLNYLKPHNFQFMFQLHATAISYHGSGVLIRGPAGIGKSDLALRLIHNGADLIADDRVSLDVSDKKIFLSAPPNIIGLIEIRGIGLIKIKAVRNIPLCLIVDLRQRNEIDRMPEHRKDLIENISVPIVQIDAFECSAPAKIKFFLKSLNENGAFIE